jgi:hypothetical protein
MDGRPGRISHYSVLGELGRDRLGYVLRAKDEQLDRPVVLRVVRASSAFPPDRVRAVRAAIQREAKRAAKVSHPNLVTIYAFEPIDDVDLIALELVEGASLRAMLALGDRWRVPEAAKLVARIADALAVAHAAQITHGRLNLANVIIRPDGRVKVLDLGVPKLPDEASPDSGHGGARLVVRTGDVRSDLLGLGLIAWELAASAQRAPGALWRPATLDGPDVTAFLSDPSLARARFGVLGPILARTLAPAAGEDFRDAAGFRDAILAALAEPVTRTATPPAFEESAIEHHSPMITVERGARIDGEALSEIDARELANPGGHRAPRLVLPRDLAEGGTLPPHGDTFVVMSSDDRGARLRAVAGGIGTRMARRADRVGPTAWIAGMIVLVLAVGGAFAARRFLPIGPASAAILAHDDGSTPPPKQASDGQESASQPVRPDGAQPEETAARADSGDVTPSSSAAQDAGSTGSAPAPESSAGPLMRTATVRGTPAGTTISIRGRTDERWTDVTELSVPEGDSVLVQFSRPGYVTATRTFKGSRLAVALQPDSVFARFESNVRAQVYLTQQRGAPRLLGTTDFSVRLATGSYQLVFRASDQADWTTTERLNIPGRTYTIRKTDYVADGSLLVTVTGTWAWVSVDGGPPQETPVRIDRLSTGTHTIRVTREGFVSVDDTVVIRAGQTVTKPYTLRPTS